MASLADRAREHQPERHSSVWGWALAGLVVTVMLDRLVTGCVSAYGQRIWILAGINITLAVSLNVINGLTGQFSIGHAGFMAVGAYVAAAVTVFGGTALERAAAGGALDPARPVLNLFLLELNDHPPALLSQLFGQCWFLVALLAGGLAAALAGVAVGIPTLRLRGDYLAIATLGFGEIVRVVLLNVEVLGGASGFRGAEPFYRIPSYTAFFNVYLVALVCILAVTNLRRGTHGRALLAVREDEIAAEAVGIDTTRYKVLAFAFSAFFAGLGGGLLGHYIGLIIPSPTMFGFMRSIEVITMVVLGGSGSTTGCVLAAVVMTVMPERLRDLAEWRMVLYAEILLVMMLVRRQGLMGSWELTSQGWYKLWHFLRRSGLRGTWARLRHGLAVGRRGLGMRWFHEGRPRWSAWFGLALIWLPLLDLALAWLLRAPGATRWVAATGYGGEVVSSLSALFKQAVTALPNLSSVANDIKLPLPANLGLSVALLPLWLPWAANAHRVGAGDRRAGWVVAAAGLLGLWHGGGLLVAGVRGPRPMVEALGAVVLLGCTAAWSVVERRWRREAH